MANGKGIDVIEGEVLEGGRVGSELMVREEPAGLLPLGSLMVHDPEDVINVASRVAGVLADVIREKGLARRFRANAREYVYVEGWELLAAMMGLTIQEVSTEYQPDGKTIKATMEVVRNRDGAVIGRASAILGGDEWADRPQYARFSMAQTRATGKALRLNLSWIMNLAGYEATPAEEMTAVDPRSSTKAAKGPESVLNSMADHVMATLGESKEDAVAFVKSVLKEHGIKKQEILDRQEEAMSFLREAITAYKAPEESENGSAAENPQGPGADR